MKAEKEFSHGRDDSDHLGLAAVIDEVAVARVDGRFATDGDQGRHIKSGAKVAVAGFRDVPMPVDAGAGLAWPWVKARMSDPLRSFHGRVEDEQLTQDTNGAFVSEAGDGSDELVFALQQGIALEELKSGGLEFFDAVADLTDSQPPVCSDRPGGGAQDEGC